MLVLARKLYESVVISVPAEMAGSVIRVTVVEARAGTTRLGIEADRGVQVMREEVAGRDRAGGPELGPGHKRDACATVRAAEAATDVRVA